VKRGAGARAAHSPAAAAAVPSPHHYPPLEIGIVVDSALRPRPPIRRAAPRWRTEPRLVVPRPPPRRRRRLRLLSLV